MEAFYSYYAQTTLYMWSQGDLVQHIGFGFGIISILLSFCLPRQGIKLHERLSPVLLQILLIPAFDGFPFTVLHGTPEEESWPMFLTFVWAGFVCRRCWRFYKSPSCISRWLAVVLFVEAVAFVLASAEYYMHSCLFFRARLLVWPDGFEFNLMLLLTLALPFVARRELWFVWQAVTIFLVWFAWGICGFYANYEPRNDIPRIYCLFPAFVLTVVASSMFAIRKISFAILDRRRMRHTIMKAETSRPDTG